MPRGGNQISQQMQQDMPVMEVYDQTKFIENRNEKIKEIKHSSKQMNDIAQQISDKVIEHDN
jgi:hypothetical protein